MTYTPVNWEVVGPLYEKALKSIKNAKQTNAWDEVEVWELQDIARHALNAAKENTDNG